MEQDQETSDSAVVRRRRRVARPVREKTPEPGLAARRNYSDESSSNFEPVQTVVMQIRPPKTMSAHESKILRRRDKTFASAAARSHSQPREAERLSSPEAFTLLRTVEKRSLSSPRHKEESSEGERYATSPDIQDNYSLSPSRLPPARQPPKDNANLSRLEQNLQRFEDERRRFELEKRIFEKEKREHKVRYKQYLDNEERKRLMENYRKMSDRMPNDPEERRRLVHSLRLSKNEAAVRVKPRPSRYESSTPVSSSESEALHGEEHKSNHRSPPPQSQKCRPKEVSPPVVSSPAPPVPVRRSVSRNNSLSPIRPARRSKTPDTGNDISRKSSIEDPATVNLERKSSLRSSTKSEHDNELKQRALEEIYRNASFEETKTQSLGRKKSSRSLSDKNSLKDDEVKPSNGSSKPPAQISLERKRSLRESTLEKARKLSLEKAEAIKVIRKRSLESSQPTEELAPKTPSNQAKPPTLISRVIAYLKHRKDASKDHSLPPAEKLLTKAFFREMFRELRIEWVKLKADYPQELEGMCHLRNKCVVNSIILVLLCGFGGLMFRYTEGSFENIYKCEVRKVKRDFIDHLWTLSHNTRETIGNLSHERSLENLKRSYTQCKSWEFVDFLD